MSEKGVERTREEEGTRGEGRGMKYREKRGGRGEKICSMASGDRRFWSST